MAVSCDSQNETDSDESEKQFGREPNTSWSATNTQRQQETISDGPDCQHNQPASQRRTSPIRRYKQPDGHTKKQGRKAESYGPADRKL